MAASSNILVIQSFQVKPYEKALKGFKSICKADITRIILSENKDVDIVTKINNSIVDLFFTIGISALSKVKKAKVNKKLQQTPVIYSMVLNPEPLISDMKQITGISLNIPQDKKLKLITKIMPSVKRIGLLYCPKTTGHIAKSAIKAARQNGIKMIVLKTDSPKKVPVIIKTLIGKIDLFWMLPDLTLYTSETVEALFLFSFENKIPVLTFSKKYIKMGALISIGIDAEDIGCQAGEMAKKILAGEKIENIKRSNARRAVVSINYKIAEKLKIPINKKNIREKNP